MESSGKNKNAHVSELRKDLVTGNWIVIAKGRADRPIPYRNQEQDREDPIETCPFENPKAYGNADPVLMFENEDQKDSPRGPASTRLGEAGEAGWSLQVIPNKYPAFSGGGCPTIVKKGPYDTQEGFGFHEVIITRDHTRHLALFSLERVHEVLRAYKERYLVLKNEECVKYIAIFHNHKRPAGASLTHPHSQLIAIPILPSDIRRSLLGSLRFYRKHNECVHCAMLLWEREEKKRIVFENNDFIVLCPFISRDAYGMRVYPKIHTARFENTENDQMRALAEVFHEALKRLNNALKNPPYNFYLHTSPIDGKRFDAYHWHFEIRPKHVMGAGFELGTGVEISTVEPERAAEVLRG